MNRLPDITGFPLDEALVRCKELGYKVDLLITRPLKEFPGGEARAVRFKRLSGDKGVLTVVYALKGGGGGKVGL